MTHGLSQRRRVDWPPAPLRAGMLKSCRARDARELSFLAPSPSLMLSNVRAYGEQEDGGRGRVVKTQGFEISEDPWNHEGPIRLQPPVKNPETFSQKPSPVFLSSSLFFILFFFSTPISLKKKKRRKKKCGISHAEVFRIIAGITPFM